MKRTSEPNGLRTGALISLALVTALPIFPQATFAQAWQTIDDYQYVTGRPAVNYGLTLGPNGVLYAAGRGYSNTWHALVMASADNGTTWSAPLDDFDYNGTAAMYDAGIASDSAGTLYAAGHTLDYHWIVRSSRDGGTTWSTVDDYVPGYFTATTGGITADSAGNVYAALYSSQGWLIRKGISGANFVTVDSFTGIVSTVFAHPTAGVFAIGSAPIGKNGSSAWAVRRSTDGGAHWQTVDNFQLTQYGAAAKGVGADTFGNLFVVGSSVVVYKGKGYNHWLVRKSTDGGNSWTTADNFQLCTNNGSIPYVFGADVSGNQYVAGDCADSTGAHHWIVRMCPAGATSLQISDDYQANGQAPQTIAANTSGNVFVGGWAATGTDGYEHWLVRRK